MVRCEPSKLLNEAQFHGSKRLLYRNGRWFWILAYMFFISCSIIMISQLVKTYFENPTYLSHSPKKVRPYFPTVMVCPEIYYSTFKADAFLKNISLPTGTNFSKVKANLNQLAAFYSPDVNFNQEELEELEAIMDYNKINVEEAGQRLTSTCDETILRCKWKGQTKNCSSLFRMELITYGFCCIFNGRSIRRLFKNTTIPARIKTTYRVTDNELCLIVNQSQSHRDINLHYKWMVVQGSYLYLDTPQNGTPISPGMGYWTGFNTKQYDISDRARELSDELLHCKSSQEPLQYFASYSRWNCLRECEMQQTLQKCGCLGWTHPLVAGASYCRAKQLLCSRHAFVPLGYNKNGNVCNCQRSCTFYSDVVKTGSFKLFQTARSIDPFFDNINLRNISFIRVHFLRTSNILTTRFPIVDTLNLFAQLGGIFNLFLGCSILTLPELVQLIFNFSRYCFEKRKTKASIDRIVKKN